MIGGEQQDQLSAGGSQISLEQKLDLLESRFTQPAVPTFQVPTNDNSNQNIQSSQTPTWGNQDNLVDKQPLASTPQPSTNTSSSFASASSGRISPHHHSNHSFQFSRQQQQNSPQNSNPLPQSSVRSRRRLSNTSTSFQSVAMAAARHMRKVAAASPVQGLSSNHHNFLDGSRMSNSSSNSNSNNNSNATMITSNQRHNNTMTMTTTTNTSQQQQSQTSHNSDDKQQRVVAETPPVMVSPHNNVSTPVRKPNKPNAVRHLMMANGNTGNADNASAPPQRSSPRKNKGKRDYTENLPAGQSSKIMTRSRSTDKSSPVKSTKRKSAPKRKVSSIKDATASAGNNTATPEPTKRYKLDETTAATTSNLSHKSPSRPSLSELSRDKSNLSTKSSRQQQSKEVAAPTNNRRIQDFFSVATNHNKLDSGSSSNNHKTTTDKTKVVRPSLSSSTSASTVSNKRVTRSQNNIDWEAKCQKMELVLHEKDQQLKAVTNNRTIIHTSLKAELDKKEMELESIQQKQKSKILHVSQELEDLLRWKSSQQRKELKEKLASDGARLGRIVVSKVGMRALESWEEGFATQDLEHRKKKLLARQKLLQKRFKEVASQDAAIDASTTSNSILLDQLEASESVQRHLSNCELALKELAQEELSLNDEKAAHIRALKRVAAEDSSRFGSKPKLHGRYVLHSLLGKGGFSEVWRAYDLVELREVAVKIHQLDPRWPDSKKENYTKHVSREYEIHRSVRHPRIVSLFDVFEIDNNSFATVLECCNGTDLDTLLKTKKRLPERQARSILLQILRGMRYLSEPSDNRQGIIHYDLKPGNILFDEVGDAKITDFGLSKIIDTADPGESMELTSQGAGTYWYLPPECFITNEKVRISNKVDVWSIGVIYYQMLYGVRPFGEGKSQDRLLRENTMLNADQVSFSERVTVSKSGKAFIRQCLQYDQTFRPTIAQLCNNQYLLEESF